jgi:hypothetical protein
MLCHINLAIYYQIIFQLAQHHKYQISEIENLIPYERDLYFEMLIEHIRKQEDIKRK